MMLNLEDLKKKTLTVCDDISIKGITLCAKPITKILKSMIDKRKLDSRSIYNIVFDQCYNAQLFEEARRNANLSYENLKSREFSFRRNSKKSQKPITGLKVSE